MYDNTKALVQEMRAAGIEHRAQAHARILLADHEGRIVDGTVGQAVAPVPGPPHAGGHVRLGADAQQLGDRQAPNLAREHGGRSKGLYQGRARHAGRQVKLTYMLVEAPAFEVVEDGRDGSDGCNGENATTQTTVAIVAAVAERNGSE